MKRIGFWGWCGCLGALFLMRGLLAQESLASALAKSPRSAVTGPIMAPVQPASSTENALQAMFVAADVVFAGEVTMVHRADGFVDVRFLVDDAVRGVAAGEVYTLREWGGLWVDQVRYRVGDRRLMLLHAASALGFASPVTDSDGAIPLTGDAVAGTVDLRWVAARVARGVDGAKVAAGAAVTGSNETDAAATEATITSLERTDRGVVMDLLHAWQTRAVAAQ